MGSVLSFEQLIRAILLQLFIKFEQNTYLWKKKVRKIKKINRIHIKILQEIIAESTRLL